MSGRRVTLLDAIRDDNSLKRAPWYRTLWWRLCDGAAFHFVCRFIGCNFDTPVFRSDCLYFCTRCSGELTGRTFADLVPSDHSDFMGWDDHDSEGAR